MFARAATKKDKPSKKTGEDEKDERVRVVVRIRPPIRHDEKYGGGSEAMQVDRERNLLWLLTKESDGDGKSETKSSNAKSTKQFVFDRVLWKDSSQVDAWEAAGLGVVKAAMVGYTGCVMCYGQTGAGKTFTLGNEKEGEEGIMVQTFNMIFAQAAEDRELKYEVQLAYVQVYMDTVSDLLQPENQIDLREDPKDGVYVSGAQWDTVKSPAEAVNSMRNGNMNRNTACTKMNSDSSRSHAVLMLNIKVSGGTRTLMGKLFLVDLAGSERVKKSGVEGSAFDEAKSINQSLTTLGRCIEILASDKKERPPFREAKLTRLLSNAIGGAAKTTLIVCVAPLMTDQFETVNSLEFGQQAMNVKVRAKVNAATDFSSLTASLMSQRDAKQKPIHQLEMKVLQELQPRLDEVVKLELECKEAQLQLQLAEESAAQQKRDLEHVKKEGGREADEDKAKLVELLNARTAATEELEAVLLQLSDNAEMRGIQAQHEAEKKIMLEQTVALQEELQSAEMRERHERTSLDAQAEGAIHTARNLGQLAAYFLQTGAMQEAGDFYLQAKMVFDTALGPDHPRTKKWQQELFFLINAPAIQRMLSDRATRSSPGGKSGGAIATGSSEAAATPQEWWLQNLFDMNYHARDAADEGEPGWWMRNLYDMNYRGADAAADDDERDLKFVAPDIFSGAEPVFTPRGTLAAGPSMLGKPLEQGDARATSAGDATDRQMTRDLRFATEWVQQVFLTPRGAGVVDGEPASDIDAKMSDAVDWLQQNFATPRGDGALASAAPLKKLVHGQGDAPSNPWGSITPRCGPEAGGHQDAQMHEADNAVMSAAMQAVLATPRAAAALDGTVMAGGANKIFKLPGKQSL